jgi:hypothetical protein
MVPAVVVLDADGLAARLQKLLPRPHHRVLHDGELVGVFADVAEDAHGQLRLQLLAAEADRALDGFEPLRVREARDEVLAAVHRLGQAGEHVAVAEEVGAHGEHDVDGQLRAARQLQQHGDEVYGLGAAALALVRVFGRVRAVVEGAEAKNFLELIDEQEDVGVRAFEPGREVVGDGVGARDFDLVGEPAQRLVARLRLEGREQRGGEVLERRLPRLHLGDAPAPAVVQKEARLQLRDEAGADERGLAAARAADDGEEPRLVELVHQLLRLPVAPEEEQRLFALEGPQPDEGVRRGGRVRQARAPGAGRRTGVFGAGSQTATGASILPCDW